MAVIGKIREKSSLVMIIIGIGMLGFLFQDGAQSLLSGSGDNSLGEIGDVEVTGIDFNQRLEKTTNQWEVQNQKTASGSIAESLKEQVWNEMVREVVLESQFKELGIAVSSDELFDMVQGSNPHPQVQQAFTDPNTGEFNPSQVLQFLKGLANMPVENRTQWLSFEKGIEKERLATKYNNLLTKGLYATTNLVKRTYTEQNENRNIKFVAKRYNSIADSTISVTEDELRAYYNEHKDEYKQDASRDIEYVKFNVDPSQVDITESKSWMEETAQEFKSTEDDSSFVIYNSEEPLDQKYYGISDMPRNLDSLFFYAEKGTVTPVYEDAGAFKVTKLSNIKMIPDSVKARHILLKTTQQPSDTLLRAKIDSIKTEIDNGASFAAMAELSEDVRSAINGGDLGWFQEGTMPVEFNTACFDGKEGDLVIVQSRVGFHLIEVLKQAAKSKKVQLFTVARKNIPSNETFNEMFAEASAFYSANGTSDAFIKATEGDEFSKFVASEVKVSDKDIAGLSDVRELVMWSFNNDKGSVSAPFTFGNTYVVAHLTDIREEGLATMDQVEIQVELGAKKKKKAAMFIEEMNGAESLEALAAKVGSTVESAPNVNFSAYAIPGMGQELRINGMVSMLKEGEKSVPIEGQTGVFVVQVEAVTAAPETTDYSAIKAQLGQANSSAPGQLLEALKDKFGVVDKRYKFY